MKPILRDLFKAGFIVLYCLAIIGVVICIGLSFCYNFVNPEYLSFLNFEGKKVAASFAIGGTILVALCSLVMNGVLTEEHNRRY